MGNAKVLEIREWSESGTYRAMYTTEIAGCIFVLHAFQKKSKSGIATAREDVRLVESRFKNVLARYASDR